MEPGIYHEIENETYHAGPGISNSGLGDILQSPRHYYARHLDPARPARTPTQPQEDGTIAHCAILEPDQFHERYVVGPDVSRATKAWKEACAANPGKTLIKPDQYTRAMLQRDAVWAIPDVAEALSAGRPEVSAYWNDPETGVLCRCRPDWVHETPAGVILLDAKTYSDASPREFARQVARMRYYRQASFYSDGYAVASGKPVLGFVFAAVETNYPFAASATMLDEEALAVGANEYRRALDIYAECLRTNAWPGYPQSIGVMSLPAWAMRGSDAEGG